MEALDVLIFGGGITTILDHFIPAIEVFNYLRNTSPDEVVHTFDMMSSMTLLSDHGFNDGYEVILGNGHVRVVLCIIQYAQILGLIILGQKIDRAHRS